MAPRERDLILRHRDDSAQKQMIKAMFLENYLAALSIQAKCSSQFCCVTIADLK